MKIGSFIDIVLVTTLLSSTSAFGKGPLDNDSAGLARDVVFPLLIKANLCKTVQDCRDREYMFCVSWKTISCDVYGVTDEKLINTILLNVLASKNKIYNFSFHRSTFRNDSFFERDLVKYSNRMAGDN